MRYRVRATCSHCGEKNEFEVQIETSAKKEHPTPKKQKMVSGWNSCLICGKSYEYETKIGVYDRVKGSENDEPLPRRKGLGFWNH